jgi:hypothetical protein
MKILATGLNGRSSLSSDILFQSPVSQKRSKKKAVSALALRKYRNFIRMMAQQTTENNKRINMTSFTMGPALRTI